MKDINLSQKPVVVKEVTIGAKKLTKSMFRQIEVDNAFNERMDFLGNSVLGYVNDRTNRYLLWTKDGRLRRTALDKYIKLKPNVDKMLEEDVRWFLKKCELDYDCADDYDDESSITIADREKYYLLVEKIKSFIEGLSNSQIYI